MRHFLIFAFLLLALPLRAQTVTPNLGLSQPAENSSGWGTKLNTNWAVVDTIFGVGSCGDATHALGYSPLLKSLICQTISAGGTPAFSTIQDGTNTTAAMIIGTGASLTHAGSGSVSATDLLSSTWANPAAIGNGTPAAGTFTTGSFTSLTSGSIIDSGITGSIQCLHANSVGLIAGTGQDCSQATWGTLTSGTNSQAAMVVTTGASLTVAGSGTINSTSLLSSTWAIPAAIGSTTPAAGAFTSLNSDQVVDAASKSGTHWTDKAVTAYGSSACSSGCTIVVPDPIADNGSTTTPSIPSNVNLLFPGSAIFTSCTITIGRYTKLTTEDAQLQLSGSGCIGINETTQALFQTNDKQILDGVRINSASQTNSTGVFIGAGTAQHANYNTSIENSTVGMQYDGTQFAESYNMNLFQNTTGLIIHSLNPGGGGNSNTFYGLKTGSNTVGTLIYADTAIGQGANYFINHSCLANSVNCMAAFGNSFQTDVHWYGGAPENNASGSATATVNGKVVKKSTFYGNLANLFWTDVSIAEASADPVILLENHSQGTITNPSGYGPQFGRVVQADSTSYVGLEGTLSGNGEYQNVTSFPSNITAGRGAMAGAPISYLNSSVPNAYAGNPLTPPFSSTTGTSSNATAVDSLYGTVNTVTFAASAGSSSSNEIQIANAIPNTTAVTSDYLFSILVKASATTTVSFYSQYSGGNSGFVFTNSLTLQGGQWTRVVMYSYGIGAGNSAFLTMFPLDSAGATVSFTRLETLALPTGSGTGSDTGIQSAYARAQVLQSGAVNPNNTACAQSGTAANPSVVSCGFAPKGIVYCDVAASAGTCTVNTTAVTTNSSINITPSVADGALLSKTCNPSPSVVPAIFLAVKVNTTSFTINMPTGAINGFCFEYSIVN